jgi:hypothetical protein
MKNNQMYCVRCRKAVVSKGVKQERDRRGRLRVKGKCPHCDTKTFKYVSER